MSKRFKQVSTGLTLVCNREDVIKQYEKYPEAYIPLDNKPKSAPKTEEKQEESPKAPEKK
jgi:hypothetical protein